MINEIGGFFELELNCTEEYHKNALALNTGRNALEYILRTRKFEKIYLPYYSCSVLLEPLKKLDAAWEFYHIDENMEPKFEKKPGAGEALLYINYFGLKQQAVCRLKEKFTNLIIDNSQAFYAEPLEGLDTFYSPRKFFGVPDGAYLYSGKSLDTDLPIDLSFRRMTHLLKRVDCDAGSAYEFFLANERELCNQPIKKISKLTRALLASIDYQGIKTIRERNFHFYHHRFKSINRLNLDVETLNGPMVYPLLLDKRGVKEQLIKKNIYIATYWKEICEIVDHHCFEKELSDCLLALPIDQRYSREDLKVVAEEIGEC
jgi:hypothetical protein